MVASFAGLNMTIYATSLWPYTLWVTKNADVTWLGYALAGTSLSSIMADPLFGWWQQRTSSIPPMLCGFTLTLFGNLFYALLPQFPETAVLGVLIISRLCLGFTSSAIGLLRTFVSMNTLEKDRLLGTAALSIGLTLGLSLGPVVQMACIPIGEKGITILGIIINQYTVPGILMSILCLINLFIVKFKLTENFAGFLAELDGGTNGDKKEVANLPPYDKCILSAVASIVLIKSRLKHIDNRIQLSIALCLFIFASLSLFPWSFFPEAVDYPLAQGQNPPQCDAACLKRRPPIWLYFFSMAFCYGPGAAIGMSVTNTLATLVVGPRKQALIQGFMTASGSLSSFLWPLGAT
ncbi:unnamed protein product, partial [Mesorhabditis spiculigera]